jgi:hypothetical protein
LPDIGFQNNRDFFIRETLNVYLDNFKGLKESIYEQKHIQNIEFLNNQVNGLKALLELRNAEVEAFKQYEIDYVVDYFKAGEPLNLQTILDFEIERLQRIEQKEFILPKIEEAAVVIPAPEFILPKKTEVLYLKFKILKQVEREAILQAITVDKGLLELMEYKFKQEE